MSLGPHISLIGIDGAGKTSIAFALAASMTRKGYEAEVVSWRSVMRAPDSLSGTILGHHAMTSTKLQLCRATSDRAIDLPALLSDGRLESFFRVTEPILREIQVRRNEAFPFVSSALLELSGSIYLHHAYISERRLAGRMVIEESCGFKHVLKNVLMTQRLAGKESSLHRAAAVVLETAQLLFGTLLPPTHGYWIDTDPVLASTWRTNNGEPTTNFEDYGLLGTDQGVSFLAMQEDCRRAFARAAEAWRWRRMEMPDRPKGVNIQAAVDAIEDDVMASGSSGT